MIPLVLEPTSAPAAKPTVEPARPPLRRVHPPFSQEPAVVLRLDFVWEDPGLRHVHQLARLAAVAAASPVHHFCGCGLVQRWCAACSVWVCEAPGHIKHVCKAVR